ncbi:MAG: hypothetical protein EZS28_040129, partial [Streblomastix strix]
MKQLLQGLTIMHEKGIIHRDIKGQNILLHSPPGSGRVILKIADYGLVKKQEHALQSVQMTIAGTTPFQAPEMLMANARDVKADSTVDIWSAGIVFYQLATHEFPFDPHSLQSIMSFMMNKVLDRPASIEDDQEWDLITKMLSFDRKDRYTASRALDHPFFKAVNDADIPENAIHLAQQAQIAQQQGDISITQFDIDATFAIPLSDTREISGVDPEIENETIVIDYPSVNTVLRLPLSGTEQQNNQLIQLQETKCNNIVRKFKNVVDDEGRKLAIRAGIAESLTYIYETRELSTITQPYSAAYRFIAKPSSVEVRQLLYSKKPYPGLIRLLEHQDSEIVDHAVVTIYNILVSGISTNDTKPSTHFDDIQACDGIDKIFDLFKNNISKYSKDLASICIGRIFKATQLPVEFGF